MEWNFLVFGGKLLSDKKIVSCEIELTLKVMGGKWKYPGEKIVPSCAAATQGL